MMLVTFARPMPPFVAGEKRLLPQEVIDQLEADDIAAMEPWPAQPEAAPAATVAPPRAPERPVLKPNRQVGTPDRRNAR